MNSLFRLVAIVYIALGISCSLYMFVVAQSLWGCTAVAVCFTLGLPHFAVGNLRLKRVPARTSNNNR
jgi:hypothetical protein